MDSDMNDTIDRLHKGFDGLCKTMDGINKKLDELLRRSGPAESATFETGVMKL